jgi:catalase (peroxidase I)
VPFRTLAREWQLQLMTLSSSLVLPMAVSCNLVVQGAYTDWRTVADVIAMGTVIGVAACGGPIVPFRAGRVDASADGLPGVPEPQQDLASHTESFRRQGFTQSEMIKLVACGHTLGGVRREDFPQVIHDTSVNLTTFDSTIEFDNRVSVWTLLSCP